MNLLEGKNRIEFKDIINSLDGLELKGGFLSNLSIKVENPEELANSILDEMVERGLLKIHSRGKVISYELLTQKKEG